ncbi:enoyl-CoA hydratase/isomerase family protein [Paraburkholderia fungorum]|uniref:enoyl-CoA hydratase/isomerase family protein n=1 Tax=Paraburkholderia fungorum TaxID=134537 RepID=UPI000ADA6661|nr:enoyl-CoA hydratase/isomerase family protein [Paraburkholderia fungorum]MBU7436198.1 enoyl-CoA hydratase/isomerase family protein [Paraburkholderia fungorum]
MENTSTAGLRITTGQGIQTWHMGFAPVNALNPKSLAELRSALAAAIADKSLGAIVLTSDLKVFSAGGDASWMRSVLDEKGADGLVDDFNQIMDVFRQLCAEMRRSPLLIIAALNGHTLAGGLELAAACDLRHAANNDRLQIGVPEMSLFGAMPSGGGGSQFIARLMGPSGALQFILDAVPISPAAALENGLVDRLCNPESLLPDTEAFAEAMVAKAGRIGIAAAKRAIFEGTELPLMSAMTLDHAIHWDAMRRGNFRAGAVNFVKRFG